MENRIFTQDPIYIKILSEITNQTYSENEIPVFDKQCKYGEMLETYCEIVVQRMSDQLPLMIIFYMYEETALSVDILKLLEKPDVHELLSEDSEVSRRRSELRARLTRLTRAAEVISSFFKRLENISEDTSTVSDVNHASELLSSLPSSKLAQALQDLTIEPIHS